MFTDILEVLAAHTVFGVGFGFLLIILYVKTKRKLWLYIPCSIVLFFPALEYLYTTAYGTNGLVGLAAFVLLLVTGLATIRWMTAQLRKLGRLAGGKGVAS